MDRGAWQAAIHRAAESDISDWTVENALEELILLQGVQLRNPQPEGLGVLNLRIGPRLEG